MQEVKKILSQIRQKNYQPVYFLTGDEPYYIDQIADVLANEVLNEDQKGFDQMVIYGKDTTVNDLIANAKRFPLMSDYQVIIVKEAQDLSKDIDLLESYLAQVQPTTILVICYKYKKIDKRKKLYKTLQKNAVFFESQKVRDYHLEGWVNNFLKSQNYSIEPKAAAMLVEFIGNDLHRIANEVNKLRIILPENTHITADHIETNIGISKEFNNFELIKAIANKDETTAFKIGYYFAQNSKNNPLPLTFGLLNNYFNRLLKYQGLTYNAAAQNPKSLAREMGVSEYAMRDYQSGATNYPMKKVSRNLHLIRKFDMKSKGVDASNISHLDIMNELLAELFY